MKWGRCSRGIFPLRVGTRANQPPESMLDRSSRTCGRLPSATSASLGVETRGDLHIRIRPMAMKRCVGNLVANAQRHAERVRVSAAREAQFVSIVVDDDGAGIDPAYREDVFRPFYRLDEARNQDEGGAGLGLAIARDIARSHGGDITLSDSPMGGLRAAVWIPI